LHLAWLFYLRLPYKKLRSQIPRKTEVPKTLFEDIISFNPFFNPYIVGKINTINQIVVESGDYSFDSLRLLFVMQLYFSTLDFFQ
jgi:hypothetical protein